MPQKTQKEKDRADKGSRTHHPGLTQRDKKKQTTQVDEKDGRIQLNTYFGVCVSDSRGDEHETEREEENECALRKGSRGSGSVESLEQRLPHTHAHTRKQKKDSSTSNLLAFSHTHRHTQREKKKAKHPIRPLRGEQ